MQEEAAMTENDIKMVEKVIQDQTDDPNFSKQMSDRLSVMQMTPKIDTSSVKDPNGASSIHTNPVYVSLFSFLVFCVVTSFLGGIC